MLSKFSNLLTNNLFHVSRQKTLLKRRKITSKKNKIAKKKFLEENPEKSYTNELKILQIQKELDRKVNRNHHLNELMDELFYPDVRYANEKILQQNLLNIANNPQEALEGKNKLKKQEGEDEDMERQEEIDELKEEIYLCQIPSQLFELYMKNSNLFTHYHLGIYLERLNHYFKNKAVIQERITYKWKQSLDKMKITDAEKKKKRRCPYVFIEKEELIRDEEWNKVIKDINKKIILTTEHIANQKPEDIDQEGEEQEVDEENYVDESFYSLENNCEIVLKIREATNYVPEELFDSIIKKMFVIVDLNQKDENSQEKLPIFSHEEKVKLLKVFSLKSLAKSTLTKSLHINTPEQLEKEEKRIIAIGKKICEDILNSNKCTSEDLGAVIRSDKGEIKFLNSKLLDLCKPKIFQFLTSTNLERSIDYLSVFWRNGTIKDANFIEVLVFDIYRKLPFSMSKNHLLSLFHMIEDTRLTFRESGISVNVSEIYPRFAESVAKYVNANEFSHEEIKLFVKSIYENYPLYKSQNALNILEMVSTAIVKIGNGFKLEELSQLLYRITVMGHKSKVFSKYVFQRYVKEYRKLMKEYKETKIQLIPDKSKSEKSINITEEADELPSMNEVLLEESLIMMLWSFAVNFNSQNSSMPLSEMIDIYPVHIRSQDPMIDDLIEDLNLHLKDFNFFPTIKNKEIYEEKTKDRRRRPMKTLSLLFKTNSVESYQYQYKEHIALELLQKLEQGREPIGEELYDKLVLFLVRYYLVTEKIDLGNLKLSDRWNDSVTDVFQHRSLISEQIKQLFLQNIETIKQENTQKENFTLCQRIKTLVENKNLQSNSINGENQEKSEKKYKLYELL